MLRSRCRRGPIADRTRVVASWTGAPSTWPGVPASAGTLR